MARFLTGQVAVTGAAAALSTKHSETAGIYIRASGNNAAPVYLGAAGVTTGTGFELLAGETLEIPFENRSGIVPWDVYPDELFVIGTSGDKVSWFAGLR